MKQIQPMIDSLYRIEPLCGLILINASNNNIEVTPTVYKTKTVNFHSMGLPEIIYCIAKSIQKHEGIKIKIYSNINSENLN